MWNASLPVTHTECEKQVRRWRPELLRPEPSQLVDSQEVRVPRDFTGRVQAFVLRDPEGRVHGHLQYFGAKARQCLSVLYSTRDASRNADVVIAARLDALMRQSLAGLAERSVEQRFGSRP